MTRRRASTSGGVAFAVMVSLCGVALADAPSGEDIASARVLGTAGIEAAEKGDCATAVPKLDAAEKLFHAPTTATWLGQCQITLGHIVQGTETLTRVVNEPLAPTAPPVFADAKRRAATVLAQALPRIGKLRIHIEGPSADAAKVDVDGANVIAALRDEGRPTDPGQHIVHASAEGFAPTEAKVALAEGETKEVTVSLPRLATAAPTAVAVAPVEQKTEAKPGSPLVAPTPPASRRSYTPSIVSFSIGGAGIVTGAVAGAIALGAHSTLTSACGPSKTACPSSDSGTIQTAKSSAWVSSIGFGVGLVGVALGAIFLLTGHADEADAPHAMSVGPLKVQPYATGSTVGVAGAF